jgi:hypothetical protein
VTFGADDGGRPPLGHVAIYLVEIAGLAFCIASTGG